MGHHQQNHRKTQKNQRHITHKIAQKQSRKAYQRKPEGDEWKEGLLLKKSK